MLQHSRKRHLSQEAGEKSCHMTAAPQKASEVVMGSRAGTKVGARAKNPATFRSFMAGVE